MSRPQFSAKSCQKTKGGSLRRIPRICIAEETASGSLHYAIGQWVAGLAGAVVVLISFSLPPALLAFCIGRLWNRLAKWPWRTSIQRGLAPLSLRLLLPVSLSIAQGTPTGSRTPAGAVP